MIRGDPAAEEVFFWTKDSKAVDRRGAGPLDASIFGRGAGEGFGVHICTGPISVKDAEPGDVIEVRIDDIVARPSASPGYEGRYFGSTVAAWWGYHYGELIAPPKPREHVTIYEIFAGDGEGYAEARYAYDWVPQVDPFGVVHRTYDYPGVPVDTNRVACRSALSGVRIPLRPHFGVIALAPREADLVNSVPPAYFGGNLDNWRLGKGSAVYLPVSVTGGLLSIGDPHAAQGDGELAGTAIECSMTGRFTIVLHKRDGRFADLDYPLIETSTEWVLTGFSHPNYLAEFGAKGQGEVYAKSSLDLAMKDAFRKARRFLMEMHGLSEDEAVSLMSAAVDFGVTQVVDGNWGVHAIVRKSPVQDLRPASRPGRTDEIPHDRRRPEAGRAVQPRGRGGRLRLRHRPDARYAGVARRAARGDRGADAERDGESDDACSPACGLGARACRHGARLSHPLSRRLRADEPVYRSFFREGRLPARTCVGVTGLAYDALIEIDLVAKRATDG